MPEGELAGYKLVLPDMIEQGVFTKDELGRDKLSYKERIAEYERIEASYQENKHAPLPVDLSDIGLPSWGIILIAGNMGAGKTTTAALIQRRFRMAGWNSFSTNSSLIGQRFNLMEALSFPDHVTRGSFVLADEVQNIIDRFASNSIRNRTFGQSTTLLRREQVLVAGTSAFIEQVGWEYKTNAEFVIFPAPWYPAKYDYPPYCYIDLYILGEYYYRRVDEAYIDAFGAAAQASKYRKVLHLNPAEVWATTKIMDTFETVTTGEQFDIGAKQMREMRENRGSEPMEDPNDPFRGQGMVIEDKVMSMLAWYVQNDMLRGEQMVHWGVLKKMMEDDGVKVTSQRELRNLVQFISMDFNGKVVSDRGINIEQTRLFVADTLAKRGQNAYS